MLTFYRRLIALRRETPSLVGGGIDAVAVTGDALVYDRRAGQERLRIALNMSGQRQCVDGMGGAGSCSRPISTGRARWSPAT